MVICTYGPIIQNIGLEICLRFKWRLRETERSGNLDGSIHRQKFNISMANFFSLKIGKTWVWPRCLELKDVFLKNTAFLKLVFKAHNMCSYWQWFSFVCMIHSEYLRQILYAEHWIFYFHVKIFDKWNVIQTCL